MIGLSDFPIELLHITLSHLSRKDLTAISHVSTRFHNASEPFLYKNIDLLKRGELIHLLLRTLITRPELASYIWHFELSSWIPDNEVKIDWTGKEEQLSKALVSATNILPENSGFDIIHSTVDAAVALVLSMCTNLKTLHLVFDCSQSIANFHFHQQRDTNGEPVREFAKHTLSMFLKSLLHNSNHGNISSFRSLRNVKLGSGGAPAYYRLGHHLALSQSLSLFYLPNIQKLALSQLEPQLESIPWPITRPCASSLTHLELTEMAVTIDALEGLLQGCPNLKDLEVQCTGYLAGGKYYFDCNAAIQSLWHINETLEHLILDFVLSPSDSDITGMVECWPSGTMNFSNFPKLQTLQLPIAMLLGMDPELPNMLELADVLPSSLRKLVINDGLAEFYNWRWDWEDDWMARFLSKLVTSKNARNLCLEAIMIACTRFVESEKITQAQETLNEMCNDFGVIWEMWP